MVIHGDPKFRWHDSHSSRGHNPKTQQPHRRQESNEQSPSANAELAPVSEGVYVGDGLPPVPVKLAAKIRKGEFVEIGELLPEFWSSHREEDIEGKHEVKVRRSQKITDIFTWQQCFGSYVRVHAHAVHPELDTRIDGIHGSNCESKPELCRAGLGVIRCGLLKTGRTNMQYPLVNHQFYSLHNLLHGQSYSDTTV